MRNLFTLGRVFYGIAIAGLGFQTISDRDFPYMLIPAEHAWIPGLAVIACLLGAVLVLAGACIVFEIQAMSVSLILGTLLLLIFCFYFIPFQFIANPNYMHFGEWENAEKELALSAGAFVIAAGFKEQNENPLTGILAKLIPIGAIIFSLTMICFGIDHFLFPGGVAEYMPVWIPFKAFWAYFTGTALIGSGLAIILKVKPELFAALLGVMIFIWVIILHIPKVIAVPVADRSGELASAFLALAYCGIAFAIAGTTKKQSCSQF
jgi:uncharacterized membrane protein YphA (DoxX/SURF4 family)